MDLGQNDECSTVLSFSSNMISAHLKFGTTTTHMRAKEMYVQFCSASFPYMVLNGNRVCMCIGQRLAPHTKPNYGLQYSA